MIACVMIFRLGVRPMCMVYIWLLCTSIQYLQIKIAGDGELTDNQKKIADYNNDGKIDVQECGWDMGGVKAVGTAISAAT